MAGRSNKMTIRVEHSRGSASVVFSASGHLFRKRLSVGPTKFLVPVTPRADTTGHYWADVLSDVIPNVNPLP